MLGKWLQIAVVLGAAAACGQIEQQSTLARPLLPGKAYVAGVGDTVMDLKQTQSLPNVVGKADVAVGEAESNALQSEPRNNPRQLTLLHVAVVRNEGKVMWRVVPLREITGPTRSATSPG